jgi:cell division inhibitor SulA
LEDLQPFDPLRIVQIMLLCANAAIQLEGKPKPSKLAAARHAIRDLQNGDLAAVLSILKDYAEEIETNIRKAAQHGE